MQGMKKTGKTPAAVQLILFCVGIIAVCPLRIRLMMTNMDPITGFYNDPSDIRIIISYAVIAAVFIAAVILSLVRRRFYTDVLVDGRNIPLAVAALIYAGGIGYETYSLLTIGREKTATLVQKAELVAIVNKLSPVFAVLTIVWLLVYAVSFFSGRQIVSKLRVIALAPFVWSVVELIGRLVITIGYLNVSELMLEMLSLCARMWFFMSLARLTSHVDDGFAGRTSLTSAVTALLLTTSFTLPRLILTASGNSSCLVQGYPLSAADAGFCLFALCFALTVFLAPPRPEKQKEEEPQPAAAPAPAGDAPISASAVFPVLDAKEEDIASGPDSVAEVESEQ